MSWYVLCVAGAASLTLLGPAAPNGSGALSRQVVLLACVAVYVFRAAQTLFVFVKRRVPWWEAIWGGSIIGCVLFFFLLGGLRTSQPIGAIDIVGVLLYIGGSYIGTAAERSRHVWKARAEESGPSLYTRSIQVQPLHQLLRRPAGVRGPGDAQRQLWTAIVPLAMGLNLALVIIPAHDAYLAARYGNEFEEYARRTNRLVPLLY